MRKNASSTLSPVLADASMYIRPKEAKGQQCGAQVVEGGAGTNRAPDQMWRPRRVSPLVETADLRQSNFTHVVYLSQREAPTCLVADQHNHSVGVREIPGVGEPSGEVVEGGAARDVEH